MRAPAALALVGLGLALSGCGTARDWLGDQVRPTPVYDQPLANDASRAEPFVNRMRTPVPDQAWARESSSEYEPWTAPPGPKPH